MGQEVLDKILVEMSNIKENMATKSDLSELRSEMATKSSLADLQKSIEVIRKQTAENAELRSSHFELKSDVADMAADIKLLKRVCI